MLESDGRVILTDFGLGRRRARPADGGLRGSGTPVFMAPELLAGDPSTPSSDLYALGVTLRWALTGRPPFRAGNLQELRAEALTGPAQSLRAECPDAPAALVAAIERAMAPCPGDRFPHAAALVSALIEPPRVAAGNAGNSTPPRRAPLLLPALAAGLGIAVLSALWLVPRMSGNRATPPTGTLEPPAVATTAAPAEGVPQPAVTTKSAAPAGGYIIEAALVSRNGGSHRHLAAGDRIAPGDWLSLDFMASTPMWVYVLNEDERGEMYLLFPQPLFDRTNPVPPDSTIVLSGPIGRSSTPRCRAPPLNGFAASAA
ncbi:MAG: DUF4384 domain-containing protein [Candidatus Eisenbacteria bacterium]|nr:DUF4384 domain-containing protein [Candidatus Eisenbacteria bacterium]